VGIELFELHGLEVFPNPISLSATFKFSLRKGQELCLTLMDNQGRVLRKELFGFLNAGDQQIVFHRIGLDEGLYFFRLENRNREGLSGTLMMGD
jgi:hypothetical protein